MSDSDWSDFRVGDLIERHFCGPSPDCEERQVFDDCEWGVLKTTAITWTGWDETAHKVLPKAFWNQPELEIRGGDVLVTKAGPRHRVGVVCHVPSTKPQLIVSGKMIALRPRQDLVTPLVLAGLIGRQQAQKYIHDRTTGMAESQVNFANGVLLRTPVRVPPPAEQVLIGKILAALDTAIHETEAIIAKLKAVKQGLLHDLLTRGIDANGELRPPQSEAPHLYKPSPLGWIPKEWDTHVFGDIIEHVIDFRGRTPKKLGMDWGGGDILALSANNVQPGAIDISREAYFGSELLYRKWMTSGDVRKGDVLLTMEAPLGNVAQIPDDARYILSQRVIALRFNARVILNDFAFWQMQCHEFQSAMASRSTGSTATGIQRAELVKLHFKAPAIWEQSLIVERLASIEHKLQSERLALAKRIQQKAGLMDDLLTGRVRVTPLLQEAQRA
jgi:type I restriction enzyme S subunit